MIPYRRGGLGTIRLLIGCRGSVVPKTLIWSSLSTLLSVLIRFYSVPACAFDDISCGMLHPSVFTWYFQLATFMLAFHCNNAYNRFWEARTQIQSMSAILTSFASHAIVLCTPSQIHLENSTTCSPEDKLEQIQSLCVFKAKILHLLSLLHAVMTQYLLNQDFDINLEVLGGVTDNEMEALATCSDQVYVVKTWISEIISLGFWASPPLTFLPSPPPAPICSRLYTDLSSAASAFQQSCKVEDTPFPFPYQQLMAFFAILNIVMVPWIVSNWVYDPTYSGILTFVIVFTYSAIYDTTAKMEHPFGTKPNDLPLVMMHTEFVSRLRDLLDSGTRNSLKDLIMMCDNRGYDMPNPDGVTSVAPFTNKRVQLDDRMDDFDKSEVNIIGVFENNRVNCTRLWGRGDIYETLIEEPVTSHSSDIDLQFYPSAQTSMHPKVQRVWSTMAIATETVDRKHAEDSTIAQLPRPKHMISVKDDTTDDGR